MSNYRGHLIGGIGAYAAVVCVLSLSTIAVSSHLVWFLATLAGALFPDIDVRSKGQHLFLSILLLLLILCLFLQAYVPVVMILFFSTLPIVIPHRGLFHDLGFVGFLSGAVALFLIYLLPAKAESIVTTSLFFHLGVISHLLLDKGFKKTFYKK